MIRPIVGPKGRQSYAHGQFQECVDAVKNNRFRGAFASHGEQFKMPQKSTNALIFSFKLS
jgi:hypothetical protein